MTKAKPTIGKVVGGGPLIIDVAKLVESRLLLQANSGAGKSWAGRRLLEQTHGQIQQIIIDPEDEFHTLRERYDYVLAGRDGGDCPAEPRSADLLARRILELGVSTIIGIFELKAHERFAFVRKFLEALVNAPRRLWHPALVFIDEAHMFCPEKGKAESAGAVIDLMTRGRKRGFCGVLATQRISKLHKDAAAETNNKLIGRAALDIDMKRASEELGFNTKEQQRSLRTLKPGHFFAFGPAFCEEVELIKVGKVVTPHPKAGQRAAPPAPPRARIKKMLKELVDLPEEAAKEIQDLSSAKKEISSLRRELTVAKKAQPVVKQKGVTQVERDQLVREIKAQVEELVLQRQVPVVKVLEFLEKAPQSILQPNLAVLTKDLQAALEIYNKAQINSLHSLREAAREGLAALAKNPVRGKLPDVAPLKVQLPKVAGHSGSPVTVSPRGDTNQNRSWEKVEPKSNGEFRLGNGGERRMLEALVKCHPMKLTKPQWGSMSKMTHTGGSFQTYVSKLRQYELFDEDGEEFFANENTFALLGEVPDAPQNSQEMVDMWKRILGGTPAKMIDVVQDHPNGLGRESLAGMVNMAVSGGSFSTYISKLKTNKLITVQGGDIYPGEMMSWEPQ